MFCGMHWRADTPQVWNCGGSFPTALSQISVACPLGWPEMIVVMK